MGLTCTSQILGRPKFCQAAGFLPSKFGANTFLNLRGLSHQCPKLWGLGLTTNRFTTNPYTPNIFSSKATINGVH